MKYRLKPSFSISESTLLGKLIRLCNWIRTHPRNMHSSPFHLLKETPSGSRNGNYIFSHQRPFKNFLIDVLDWIPLSGDVGFITKKRGSVFVYSVYTQVCSVWNVQNWAKPPWNIKFYIECRGECASGFTQICAFCNVGQFFSVASFSLFFFFSTLLFSEFWGNLLPAFPCLFFHCFLQLSQWNMALLIEWLPLSFRVADAVCFIC